MATEKYANLETAIANLMDFVRYTADLVRENKQLRIDADETERQLQEVVKALIKERESSGDNFRRWNKCIHEKNAEIARLNALIQWFKHGSSSNSITNIEHDRRPDLAPQLPHLGTPDQPTETGG